MLLLLLLLYLPNALHLRRRRGATTEVTDFFSISIALLGVLLLLMVELSRFLLMAFDTFIGFSIHQCNCHDLLSSQTCLLLNFLTR